MPRTLRLKAWIGNLDGTRRGLVVAPTKKRAREVIGRISVKGFDDYWHESQWPIAPEIEPETLYTRSMNESGDESKLPWTKGLCNVRRLTSR